MRCGPRWSSSPRDRSVQFVRSIIRAGTPAVAHRPPGRRPRDRKAIILVAAGELFAERGFAAVGMNDIAQRIGITGGAIYPHFPGKDAVLDARRWHSSSWGHSAG
jgi:Bacterial regulatory proteins, tetR family